jgi:hypothetical protein
MNARWSSGPELASSSTIIRRCATTFIEKSATTIRNTRPAEKWNRELAANPNFADRYRRNPGIINDSILASEEPEIGEFLRANPEVRHR